MIIGAPPIIGVGKLNHGTMINGPRISDKGRNTRTTTEGDLQTITDETSAEELGTRDQTSEASTLG